MTASSVAFGRTAPTVPATDIDKALAFYVGVLGMEKLQNASPSPQPSRSTVLS